MTYFFLGFAIFAATLWGLITNGRGLGRAFYVRFIKKGIFVTLEDMEGQTYKTVAHISPSGKMSAPVYFGTNVGRVLLEEDGTVKNHYIKTWTKG